MNAEQTHIIEMSLNILNDIAQSLKTIAENAAAGKTNQDWPTGLKAWSTENIRKAMDAPFDFSSKDGETDAWSVDRTVYEVLSQVSGSTQEGEMTNEEAIRVLAMVEAHGSLTQEAKERAIKALNQMGRIESLINMDTAGRRSIKLAELKEVIQ